MCYYTLKIMLNLSKSQIVTMDLIEISVFNNNGLQLKCISVSAFKRKLAILNTDANHEISMQMTTAP
jgi:hypothetical protein